MEILSQLDSAFQSDSSQRDILAFVSALCPKMIDPGHVKASICKPSNTAPSYYGHPFAPLTLSHGYPGLLVLFSVMDRIFPKENWDEVCHAYVLKIKEHVESEGVTDLSLFNGVSGIAFSILSASREGTRYKKLLEKMHTFLVEKLQSTFWPLFIEKNTLGLPIGIHATDLISGLAGIGAYLLSLSHIENVKELLEQVLTHLVGYVQKRSINGRMLFGWYIPRHYQLIEQDKKMYPKGNFNLGMAHGISGVLALFAQSLSKGYQVEGLFEAIISIKNWIVAKRKEKEGTHFWVDRISYEEEVEGMASFPYFTMDAWCYGSPGVARALFLTGKALQDSSLIDLATSAYIDIAQRIQKGGSLRNYSFCHGYAGLLSMVELMAKDTQEPKLKMLIPYLQKKVLEGFTEKADFGFLDYEPVNQDEFILNQYGEMAEPKQVEIEKIGLLDGTVGILLSLLQSVTGEARWTQAFLLGG